MALRAVARIFIEVDTPRSVPRYDNDTPGMWLVDGVCRIRLTMVSTSSAVSVVVCTRNRSTLLASACRSALEQRLPGQRWELVIVDNNSTDDTLEIARTVETEFPERVRVVQEPELGLSAARNAGIREAQGDIIVFLDDDAFPNAGWLRAVVDEFRTDDVQCVGGPIDPIIQGELPSWFLGRFLPYLSAWDLGEKGRELTYDEYPRGANIGFRREALEASGGFCTDLGRKGKSLLSCEEIDVCLQIERLGGRIVYVPRARVRHVVNTERLSPGWMLDRFESQGRSEAIVNWRHGGMRALIHGFGTFATRWREASSQIGGGDDLVARCHRRSFFGYLGASLPAVLGVRRCRWPDGVHPAPWAPP